MKKPIYGNLANEGLEVVQRDGRLYMRCDAGAHSCQWREDEINQDEFDQLQDSSQSTSKVMLDIQERLITEGIDPYISNWNPDRCDQE